MHTRRRLLFGTALAAWVAAPRLAAAAAADAADAAFDHTHAAWTSLLARHVVLLRDGQASQLRYAVMATERAGLRVYLDTLSALRRADFDRFSKDQQQAFLINAYNAFTVELVLTRYPDLKSIRDIGGLFGNPWKRQWIALLGATVSLDDIEHGMLRKRGAYDEPRVHFAVNCASVGCPMLREEAFVGERLDAQLAQQAERFMADRTRNRWEPQRSRLALSKIFDWYGEDFTLGHRGITSVSAFAARHADRLADAPADRERIRARQAPIGFLDYDWALNDVAATSR
jgi:hypothetical protein